MQMEIAPDVSTQRRREDLRVPQRKELAAPIPAVRSISSLRDPLPLLCASAFENIRANRIGPAESARHASRIPKISRACPHPAVPSSSHFHSPRSARAAFSTRSWATATTCGRVRFSSTSSPAHPLRTRRSKGRRNAKRAQSHARGVDKSALHRDEARRTEGEVTRQKTLALDNPPATQVYSAHEHSSRRHFH